MSTKNCGACGKKGKEQTTMKGQTSSFTLTLRSNEQVTMRGVSRLEAQATLARMGGGTLKENVS